MNMSSMLHEENAITGHEAKFNAFYKRVNKILGFAADEDLAHDLFCDGWTADEAAVECLAEVQGGC